MATTAARCSPAATTRKPGIAKLRRALGSDVTLSELEDNFLVLLQRHQLLLPRTKIDRRAVAQLTAVPSERHEDWRGAMSGQGEIMGDLVAPATDPGDWDALRG